MTGTAPAELISVMAAAHRAFEPRTSDEGRRPRSIRAAILSTPSKAPLTTTSRRTRGPSSFHLFLATRTPCAVISPAASGPARDPARDPLADDSVGQEICGRATLDAGSRKRSQPARRAAEASIEAELVALGVLHDHKAGFHAAVGVDPANPGGTEVGQAGGLGVQRGHPLVAHAAGGRTDVEVQPVLGDLALRHPLEEQPRNPARAPGSAQSNVTWTSRMLMVSPGVECLVPAVETSR